jgi:CrcB protein
MPPRDVRVLAVIAAGGALGSAARYGLGVLWSQPADRMPWTTLLINLLGALLLGMLVVAVTEIWRPHRLVRPLLGTGVLGGFTTFSTFALQLRLLPGPIAFGYLALSILGGLLAAAAGMALIRLAEPGLAAASVHERIDRGDPDLP